MSAAAVFGVLILLIVVIAQITRRVLHPLPTGSPSTPGGEGMLRLVGVLQFGTAVAAVFVPLAAALYLLVTVSWTLAQRLILRRRFPTEPPTNHVKYTGSQST